MKDDKKKPLVKGVYVGILNQGNVRPELSQLATHLTHQNKYNVTVNYPAKKPIAYNRNSIVQRFLETPADYLLMIDSDIVPPFNILNLADFQKPIIGALMFAYSKRMVFPIVMKKNKKKKKKKENKKDWSFRTMQFEGDEGLVKCDATGTGCIMIRRDVLENDWWQENEGWFQNIYDNTGNKVQGLDFSFCMKAKKLGYQTYVHLDYPCSHWVNLDLKDIYQALLDEKTTGKKVALNKDKSNKKQKKK